jgi:hypothetical protein
VCVSLRCLPSSAQFLNELARAALACCASDIMAKKPGRSDCIDSIGGRLDHSTPARVPARDEGCRCFLLHRASTVISLIPRPPLSRREEKKKKKKNGLRRGKSKMMAPVRKPTSVLPCLDETTPRSHRVLFSLLPCSVPSRICRQPSRHAVTLLHALFYHIQHWPPSMPVYCALPKPRQRLNLPFCIRDLLDTINLMAPGTKTEYPFPCIIVRLDRSPPSIPLCPPISLARSA